MNGGIAMDASMQLFYDRYRLDDRQFLKKLKIKLIYIHNDDHPFLWSCLYGCGVNDESSEFSP